LTKFQGNILSLSENIAKSYRGSYFLNSHSTLKPSPKCNLRNGPLLIAYALELFPPFPLGQS